MPNTSNIAVPIKGMITDLHLLNTNEQSYSFALNAVVEDFSPGNGNFLQNEPSSICSVTFPPNYQVVGFKEVIEQNRVIYALVNPVTGRSQIGEMRRCDHKQVTDSIEQVYCKDCPEYFGVEKPALETVKETCYCNYRMIIDSDCLGFNVDFPVDIEYKITNCSLNIYFTDNNQERRFLYFDYLDNDPLSDLLLQDRFKVLGEPINICKCPEGYTYNAQTELCEKEIQTPITPSGDLRTACKASSMSWGIQGVALYSSFNVNGTGVSTIHHNMDTFWANPTMTSTVDGRLNKTGLWACGPGGIPQTGNMQPLYENIGFIFPIEVATTKTYYVGTAGDNKIRIRVNCEDIIDMDPEAMGGQYVGYGLTAAFQFWHVYPVTLPPGRHVIELTGVNYGNVGGFGAEIYDNTSAEIMAANGGAGLNIIFSTANKAGQPLQVSSTFSGTCSSGQCLDINNLGQLVCTEIVTAEPDCSECPTPTYLDELDCDKIKVHPDVEHPCVVFKYVTGGGNLKAGVYQIMIAYADAYGNPISQYFNASPTIPIFEDKLTFETNYLTNKAITFDILNLDSDSVYGYYNIVVAQTIDNFTEFIQVGTFDITQNSYTFTGFERSPKRLSEQEVFFRRPFYQKAEGVTKAGGQLLYTGVSEYPLLNLQPVVNTIELNWETVALKEKAYHDPANTFYFHTFQRDEVYALGLVFEFGNGRETCAFHIPGRIATPTDLEIVTGADVIPPLDCDLTVRDKRWQVYNTGSVLGGNYEYNENCEVDTCWEYGRFAYWESTETYPNVPEVWGDLACKPIRHHKFPDSCVTHIHDGKDTNKVYKDNNYIFPIGIRVSHQSVLNALLQAVETGLITEEQRNEITGYRIVRGNRVGNKSIDAKGLIFNMFEYEKFDKQYYFPNYAYNDVSADDFLNGVTLTDKRYTFHSPDTHFVNASLGNILKVETEEYGESEGYFTYSDCQAKHKIVSGFIHTLAFGLGLAAALSATGEKKCKVITKKADVDIEDEDGYGKVSGTFTAILTPAGGTHTGNINTTGATINTTGKQKHNTATYSTYENNTGLEIPTGSGPAATEEITTCKGQPFQIFNSNPFLMSLFGGLNIAIQKTMLGLMEMQKILDTLRTLIPYKNYSVQYNSVGKYNNYSCVAAGNKQRLLDKTAYLNPIIQEVQEPSEDPSDLFSNIKINNWNRESSVYLKTATVLANPTHIDNSKVSMRNAGLGVGDLDKTINRDISSYYVSVKRNVTNQYGQLCNIEYLETNNCSFKLDRLYTVCEAKVFGGDTFINRFSLKRKMPFFQHTMCNLPDGSDILYKRIPNVGDPKYYFNTQETIGERITSIGSFGDMLDFITSDVDRNWDVSTNKAFYQNGVAHLFNYGIPSFLVESDINVDFRHAQNTKERDFYPNTTDLKTWLEEEYVPISEDNFFFYNRTYSKQNKESVICRSCILDPKDLYCQLANSNRLIYSDPLQTENKNDNWLIFKANNHWDFELTKGKLITADGIEGDKVLVRLTKGTQVFNAYNTIQATGENIQVGTGGLFQTRPQDIATTDLGYAGTQHRDILHTEFGHIWADAERGQVLNLATGASGLDELTKDGMNNWFKENLPFNIKKDFPLYTIIDNNLNGIGLHYCFDKRFSRILITKLDYKALSKEIKYNKVENFFYVLENGVTKRVAFNNPKYFCNKSWTISYSFKAKSWTSYHSYHPLYYVENINTFDSGIWQPAVISGALGKYAKQYTHNATNKSYQVFYGKLEPFIVEVQSKQSLTNNTLNSIEYYLDVIRYHNEFDTFHNRDKTFNKAIIYNESQTSGLLNLVPANEDDLSQIAEYPKRTADGYAILISNSENTWQFNDFYDVAASQRNNVPLFNYDCNNVNKQLNYKALDYAKPDVVRESLRHRVCKVRLINDKESRYKFIFNYAQINQKQSFR